MIRTRSTKMEQQQQPRRRRRGEEEEEDPNSRFNKQSNQQMFSIVAKTRAFQPVPICAPSQLFDPDDLKEPPGSVLGPPGSLWTVKKGVSLYESIAFNSHIQSHTSIRLINHDKSICLMIIYIMLCSHLIISAGKKNYRNIP